MTELILVISLFLLFPLAYNKGKEIATPAVRDQTIIRCNKDPKWCKEQYSFLMLREKFKKEEAKRNP